MTTTEPTPEPRRGRTGGRAGRQAARLATHIEASPFLTRTLQPFEVVSDQGIAQLRQLSPTYRKEVKAEVHS